MKFIRGLANFCERLNPMRRLRVVIALAAVFPAICQFALAQRENVLASFDGKNGLYPITNIVFDAQGNIFGVTNAGGLYETLWNGGAAYELLPDGNGGWSEKILYNFGQGNGNGLAGCSPDGYYPSGVVFDNAGNLYGTTFYGGDCDHNGRTGAGAVFQLVPTTSGLWTENIIHAFGGDHKTRDGAFPGSGVALDGSGNVYGVTGSGGEYDYGTVYELIPSAGGWTEKILHSFSNREGDGSAPSCALLLDSFGNLYGSATAGGQYGNGVVFELTPESNGSWTEGILYSFKNNGEDGGAPGSLTFDSLGNLYGSTYYGGANDNSGTVFELTPSTDGGWNEKTLYTFAYAGFDGEGPSAVTLDAAGNLYGTVAHGGLYGFGAVFELTPQPDGSWAEQVVYDFGAYSEGIFGQYPYSGVVFDSLGNLYGTTQWGGRNDDGTVFEITPQ
jgi:uncharacterized repeat protein (TIGR03803 family)